VRSRKYFAALLGALALLASLPTVAAAVPPEVTVAATSANKLDIFAVGSNNAVWQRTWTSQSGTWGSWTSLGGIAAAPPSAVAWRSGRLDVFVLGTDGQAYQQTKLPGYGWSGWVALGGSLSASVQVAKANDDRIDLTSRDMANQPVMRTWTSTTGWSQWYVIPGTTITSGLNGIWWGGATAATGLRFDVFGRGPSDEAIQDSLLGPSYAIWTGWNNLGGTLTSGVSPASPNPDRLDVAVRGSDQGIYFRTWYSAATGSPGWQPWNGLGGDMASTPAMVWWKTAGGADRVDIWARGSNGNVQQKFWTAAGGWSDWGQMAPPTPSTTGVTYGGADQEINTSSEVSALLAVLSTASDTTAGNLLNGTNDAEFALIQAGIGNTDLPSGSSPDDPGYATASKASWHWGWWHKSHTYTPSQTTALINRINNSADAMGLLTAVFGAIDPPLALLNGISTVIINHYGNMVSNAAAHGTGVRNDVGFWCKNIKWAPDFCYPKISVAAN
jgi:hypothetical protein